MEMKTSLLSTLFYIVTHAVYLPSVSVIQRNKHKPHSWPQKLSFDRGQDFMYSTFVIIVLFMTLKGGGGGGT